MNSQYRYLIPNGITFISLTCGIVAILLAATGELVIAGVLILASYILDLFDGASARYLNAGSAFGLQLDSLVDMVSLGTAPTVLAFMYLFLADVASTTLIAVLAVFFALAGAYRLARFNLLPPKASGRGDSAGLTIGCRGHVGPCRRFRHDGSKVCPARQLAHVHHGYLRRADGQPDTLSFFRGCSRGECGLVFCWCCLP